MFRTILSVVCLFLLSQAAEGQNYKAIPLKIESLRTTDDGFRYKVTFDKQVEAGDTKSVIAFVKATTSVLFNHKDTVEIKDKEVTLTLGYKAFPKSSPKLSSMKFMSSAGATVVYEITVSPWLLEETPKELSMAVTRLDAVLRGHKEGANDGISVKPTFKKTKEDSVTVTITYSGGVYNFVK